VFVCSLIATQHPPHPDPRTHPTPPQTALFVKIFQGKRIQSAANAPNGFLPVCVCVCARTHTHAHTKHTHACINARAHTHKHPHTPTCMHACIITHTHMHTRTLPLSRTGSCSLAAGSHSPLSPPHPTRRRIYLKLLEPPAHPP
jgi:hypothetical protein